MATLILAPKKSIKKKINYLKPVNINEDVWFYPSPKTFQFVVWVEIDGKRQVEQFILTHKKIRQYLP
jgi:hypothetical protein